MNVIYNQIYHHEAFFLKKGFYDAQQIRLLRAGKEVGMHQPRQRKNTVTPKIKYYNFEAALLVRSCQQEHFFSLGLIIMYCY